MSTGTTQAPFPLFVDRMDFDTSYTPPNIFPTSSGHYSPMDMDMIGPPPSENPRGYHHLILFSLILTSIDEKTSNTYKDSRSNRVPPSPSMDLVEEVKDMYRLLDLVSESGSNGCGNEHFRDPYLIPTG